MVNLPGNGIIVGDHCRSGEGRSHKPRYINTLAAIDKGANRLSCNVTFVIVVTTVNYL